MEVLGMIPHVTPLFHRGCRFRRPAFPKTCGAPSWLHLSGRFAFTLTVLVHLLIAHGAGGEWPLVETLHQGILSRCSDMMMLTLVGWPNSVAVAAELWTASERSLPMLLVPRRQPRSPSSAHVAIEAKS